MCPDIYHSNTPAKPDENQFPTLHNLTTIDLYTKIVDLDVNFFKHAMNISHQ